MDRTVSALGKHRATAIGRLGSFLEAPPRMLGCDPTRHFKVCSKESSVTSNISAAHFSYNDQKQAPVTRMDEETQHTYSCSQSEASWMSSTIKSAIKFAKPVLSKVSGSPSHLLARHCRGVNGIQDITKTRSTETGGGAISLRDVLT